MNKNRFIYGSIIMVFMNFLMKIIGFAYEVALSKFLGAEAMGLFQISMSTLMTFLIITTSGIPTSVTKLVAQENSKKNYNNVESIFNSTLTFNLFASIIISIILLLFSEFISIKMLKSKDMVLGVYFMIPAIIILSASSILRSYFYGMKDMITPSIAQIIEHLTRFIIIVGILYYVCPVEPIHGATIAILGISIGEFFDLMWSLFSKKRLYKTKSNYPIDKKNEKSYLIKVLYMSIPLTISGSFGVILRFINTILIPNRLMAAGYTSSDSISIFGRIMGMTMPLIGLSFIVTSALVVNLIPSLSEQIALKRYKDIKRDIHLSIKVTLLIALPLMSLYVGLSKPLAILLYNDPLVANFIHIMAYGTVLLALQHTFSGILLGLNKQTSATVSSIIGMILRIILIYIFVGDPRFGVNGIFISFYGSNTVILILNLIAIRSVVKFDIDYIDIIGKPLVASIFMIGFIYLSIHDIGNLQNISTLGFVSSLLVGSLAYIFVLFLTKAIPKNLFKKLIKLP
ncbi:polysaccharide biosynthesis protein [Tissierella carlieri]|uniref:Polysaccharide biosynthesis protein n=1 Tax=Tissierella carlieri TaxID=689904 RepID=A0ABT1SC31_9FIRM|nr:polysaccharide biosynthesis protein [Tissierella carlieri]MCQ4923880.1 polysaccharide biosynthesis protein [Tissierella carlieri]MDU5083462.1 polysaccharide biosynthesis protein [Bacillota bacterium]